MRSQLERRHLYLIRNGVKCFSGVNRDTPSIVSHGMTTCWLEERPTPSLTRPMETYMQTLNYKVGKWHAEALLEELEMGKLMAIISVTGEKGNAWASSKHTVVFDHQQGVDKSDETEILVRRLLIDRYGV
jgi:hypothetical protein